MKKIVVIVIIFSTFSCRSSRPKYLRCSKGKRCVEVQLKNQSSSIGFVNISEKQLENAVF